MVAFLQSKAEVMATRDLLLEKDLVSPEEWNELVTQHKKSYDYSRMIHDLEEGRDFEAEASDTQTFLER